MKVTIKFNSTPLRIFSATPFYYINEFDYFIYGSMNSNKGLTFLEYTLVFSSSLGKEEEKMFINMILDGIA